MKFLVKMSFFALVAVLLVACGSSPRDAIINFYKSVEDGDITTASSLLSARFHKQMLDEQKLKDMLTKEREKIQSLQGIKDIKVEGEPGKEVASLKVIISYGNGQSLAQSTKMVVEEGQWKIDVQDN